MEKMDTQFVQDTISGYTDSGHVELKRSNMEKISHGHYGEVYDMGNGQALKRFFNQKRVSYNGSSNTSKVIRTIKNLKLNNMYTIIDILYSNKFKLNRSFIGYIMTKYDSVDIDFTTVDPNYIISNYNSILEDFIKLANNNITVKDLHPENVIVTKDKIIIIDADNYDKSIFGPKELSISLNQSELNRLFTKLIIYSYYNSYYDQHKDVPNLDIKVDYLNKNYTQFPTFIKELKDYPNFDEYLNDKLKLNKHTK